MDALAVQSGERAGVLWSVGVRGNVVLHVAAAAGVSGGFRVLQARGGAEGDDADVYPEVGRGGEVRRKEFGVSEEDYREVGARARDVPPAGGRELAAESVHARGAPGGRAGDVRRA